MKIKPFIFFILLFFSGLLHAVERELLLRDNLEMAKPGDYLVTAQNKNFTILLIRNKNGQNLSIEEITVPAARINKTGISWKSWVESKAPGHTSWVMYTIDLPTGAIRQTFSFTKNEWVSIPQAQNFLSTLLNLRFQPILERDRKRVGPAPSLDSPDRRSVWQPPLVVNGKTVPGVLFDAWRTRWPKDSSELSNKVIEVYLPKENGNYPAYFPYWLQISGLVCKAKVRIVDSGKGLFSPVQLSPF